MTPNFRQISIDEFEKITQFKLSQYLIRVNLFFSNDYIKISNWFSGKLSNPPAQSFKNLRRLIYESDVISQLTTENKNRFNKTYFWDLLENLDDIKEQILKASKLSKYMRSAITNTGYSDGLEIEYTTNKYDTLESIQRKEVSYDDFDNQWIKIAMRNDLKEEQYDTEGGESLRLPTTVGNLFLESVVDNLIDDRMYGADFNRKITFKDDDIEVLSYKETAIQAVEILVSVRKGSVPEFPELGITEELVVGTNASSLAFPIIQRQLNQLFSTDDTLLDFSVVNTAFVDDAVFITFSVNTFRGSLIKEQAIKIQA